MSKKNSTNSFLVFLAHNYLSFGLIVATVATTVSLIFSEVLKFIPCELCWYQRIVMYPQVVLFGVALWKNDRSVVQYVLPLSIIGFIIAVYQYLLQLNPTILPCTDEIANCALKEFNLLGFITIPFMSGVAFLMIIILSLIHRKINK